MVCEHFINKHYQMQETCSKCFGSKQLNMALYQTNITEHECSKIVATYKMYYLRKGRVILFRPEIMVFLFAKCSLTKTAAILPHFGWPIFSCRRLLQRCY